MNIGFSNIAMERTAGLSGGSDVLEKSKGLDYSGCRSSCFRRPPATFLKFLPLTFYDM